jgi:hypothetical protein
MEVDAATLLLVPTAIYYLMLVFEKAFDLYEESSKKSQISDCFKRCDASTMRFSKPV